MGGGSGSSLANLTALRPSTTHHHAATCVYHLPIDCSCWVSSSAHAKHAKSVQLPAHSHTHMHTHAHTLDTHIHTHAHTHTCTHTLTHTHAHTCTHTCTHTHAHTCTHTHSHTLTHTHMHTHAHTHCTHTLTHTHAHTSHPPSRALLPAIYGFVAPTTTWYVGHRIPRSIPADAHHNTMLTIKSTMTRNVHWYKTTTQQHYKRERNGKHYAIVCR